MCSSPHWQVGQSPGRSWFREKLSPANGNKGYIAVSRFREKCFPRIRSNELPRFREKYRAHGRQKWGPTCDRDISNSAIYTTAIYRAYTVMGIPILEKWHLYLEKAQCIVAMSWNALKFKSTCISVWEIKFLEHLSPSICLIYLHKITLAQANFLLAQLKIYSHWWALVSLTVSPLKNNSGHKKLITSCFCLQKARLQPPTT